MSLSTPPPCRRPCQNHGLCGPLCSSAARARYGRPVSRAPRAHRRCVRARPAGRTPGSPDSRDSGRRVSPARRRAWLRRRSGPAASRRRCRRAAPRPRLDRVDDLLDILERGRSSGRTARSHRWRGPRPCRRSIGTVWRVRHRVRGPARPPRRRARHAGSRRRDVRVAHPDESVQVELGVEPTADDADAQSPEGGAPRRGRSRDGS